MPISINLLTICCSRILFCNFHWLPFAVEMNAVAVAGLVRLSPFCCQLAFNYELDKIPNDASKEKRESIGSEMSHNFCRFFCLFFCSLFVQIDLNYEIIEHLNCNKLTGDIRCRLKCENALAMSYLSLLNVTIFLQPHKQWKQRKKWRKICRVLK